ncbi:MAG: RNA polymerase sigma factor [Nitrospiraceae bacterium]|nr:RNA polymerase sigma factor [Nitrospiraceae bacterium]
MEDPEIVQAVKDGDIEAFSLLVEKYHRRLLNFIYRLTSDAEIAEDIGQEVFLSVYKSLDGFDVKKGVPFSAWLFIAAKNRCMSELRSRRDKGHFFAPLEEIGELAADGKSPQQALLDAEYREAVRFSLEQLPEPFRGTLLRSVLGDSVKEIAMDEGIPAGTVKSRVSRAREKMKILMTDFFGGNT